MIQFLANQNAWDGSPTAFLEHLSRVAGERQSKAKDWPKAPHILTKRIREIVPNLAAIGIEVEVGG